MRKLIGFLAILLMGMAWPVADEPQLAQLMMMGQSSGPDAGGGFVGPLDGLPAPLFVCSLRRMLSAYTGKAIHVTGSGGATSGDVGFTAAGDFDVIGYNALKGSGTEAIDTCYDQSGNGTNAVQATPSQQPTITLNTFNGHPVISFVAASNQLLAVSAIAQASPWSVNFVARGTGAEQFVWGSGGGAQGGGFDQAANNAFVFQGSGFVTGTASDTTQHSVCGVGNNASSAVIIDGTTNSGASGGAGALSGAFNLGTLSAASFQFNGNAAEWVVWAGAQNTACGTTLRSNQKTYFGTP